MIRIAATKYTPHGKQEVELDLEEVMNLMNTSDIPFSAVNKDSMTIYAGMPCSMHPSGTGILKAKSNNMSFWAFGLAIVAIEPTFADTIQLSGLFYLHDWTNITGSVNLVARAIYYLAPNGGLTVDPPTTPGYILQQIGIVAAPNTLNIRIGQPILL